MTDHPSLPFTAQAAADEATQRAVDAANRAWKRNVEQWVRGLLHGQEFTADDIWHIAEREGWPVTHEPRALGILSHLSRAGIIYSIGSRKSQRVQRHAGYVTIWKRDRTRG